MNDLFGIDTLSKLVGVKSEPPNFEVGDIVTLIDNPSGIFEGINGDHHKKLHEGNIKGRVVELEELKNHYHYGYYADVDWDNGYFSDTIHTDWLKKHEQN